MSVAACLLLYSAIVAMLVRPVLVRLTRTGIAPRLGVAAWVVALATVPAAWLTAVGFLFADLVRNATMTGRSAIGSCLAVLDHLVSGRADIWGQIGLIGFAVIAVLASGAAVWRLNKRLNDMRNRTRDHAQAAHIVGRRIAGLGAVVIDAPHRAAYCVAGRPYAIVVTSAALDALDKRQLDAVLAHERAHLVGRHPQLLAVLRSLAATFPRITLFTSGATEVALLLEICADDSAARRHDRRSLLGGLIALSTPGLIPANAMGATNIAVLARARRLTSPPRSAERVTWQLVLSAAIVLIAIGPVLTVTMARAGMSLCGSMTG